MKVKNNTSRSGKVYAVVAVICVMLLSLFLLSRHSSKKSDSSTQAQNDLEIPTHIKGISINYEKLLQSDSFKLYDSDTISIYAVNKSGMSKLVYAYKIKPEGRILSDNFFLHIYVKDSTKLLGNAKFANTDFFTTPEPMTVNDQTFYVYQRDLSSKDYVDKTIPISEIRFLNTGRYKSGVNRSLDLRNLIPQDIPAIELDSELDKVTVKLSRKGFEKIKAKRDEALEIGVLSSGDDDLIKGSIAYNNDASQKTEFRLKGDWPDHLRDEKKWSYRFIMDGGATFKGMRKFSIQHPRVRNYLWEWLFNKIIKDEEMVGLRYDFIDLDLIIEDKGEEEKLPVGIMALEESFDKILIENNQKREGLILAFDESLFWGDTKKEQEFNLDRETHSRPLRSVLNAPIRVFNENKVLSDPKLSKQFETAKDLLEGLREEKYKISEVFDMDKLTTYVALCNAFGAYHALVWHNLRIYYNPITGKLEPISYDSNSGVQLKKITQYPFSDADAIYQEQVREKLKLVSSTDYINTFIATYEDEINSLNHKLYTEYGHLEFDKSILEYNSNVIKKELNPYDPLVSSLISYNDKQITLEIKNLSNFPIEISGLLYEDGRKLSTTQSVETLESQASQLITFNLNQFFVNAFVSKKNKKGTFQYPKDIQKLRLGHFIKGVNYTKASTINPYGRNQNLALSVEKNRKANTSNYQEFDFIEELEGSELHFVAGNHSLNKDLIIPAGKRVIITPGFQLDFKNNASIKSQSVFVSKGTEKSPIKFYSSDSTGGGIFITDAPQLSEVAYTVFDNLSNPNTTQWSVSGAVNFHESDVVIAHTIFSNNRCEDALNIIRSEFTMSDTEFIAAQSDAFDGDFVKGTVTNCTFLDSGNDSIDVSGSTLTLQDITVVNPSDKGISAGENSTILGTNIQIEGGEIGVVSKDLSTVTLSDVRIFSTRLGLSAFQKKSEYGVAKIAINNLILKENELDYLIENRSSLLVDNIPVETVSDNVIDQMYGNEYGKSSR